MAKREPTTEERAEQVRMVQEEGRTKPVYAEALRQIRAAEAAAELRGARKMHAAGGSWLIAHCADCARGYQEALDPVEVVKR